MNSQKISMTLDTLLAIQPSWTWVAGAAFLASVLGFLLGWHTLGRRIRKKYGGLKIY
jgi:uncharacterized membrane protein YbhN (UPF0104 family)